MLSLLLLGLLAQSARSSPAPRAAPSPVSVSLGGVTYINQGLVAFGLIPSNATESTGDTLGGLGSAVAVKPGTWRMQADGTYAGTLVVQPDRGFNVLTTIDYQARRHELSFVLSPYTGSAALSFADAQKTLKLTYLNTTLLSERNGTKTSGLDPQAIRAADPGFGAADPTADPQMPIASLNEPHLSVDAEGIVINADGTYWLSDEYGPYIYRFSAAGQLLQTIQPPEAILPLSKKGKLNFTSEDDPDTGRGANQGFEGLTLDPLTNTLYAILQSGTIQDGAAQFTRLLAYDVSQLDVAVPLIGEWVVPLPVSSGGKVRSTSELHFVSPGVFLTLARDGNGHGGSGTDVKYKHVDLFSIANATSIAHTDFDSAATPVAPKAKLAKGVTAAAYASFLDIADPAGLARFGLHTGDPDDRTLINAKWEGLALAPAGVPGAPDDYFLFVASDNDFISTQGVSLGVPFDAGEDVDSQFLVFRVTLPGAAAGVKAALGL
ncbi:Phytase-like domain-containing protein [Mycena indigotica]|uniref:Phytase-like domain-containing protein n=1 Tax=Mycena indigotica TaxID=2126181 RepID=A0A8H6S1M0_9AGAR|nr:Phytase-like domain-containing protein [Mycena indigotica]KAF7291259.1 Phytase-like domain-containing protein [Mycena indigotica]